MTENKKPKFFYGYIVVLLVSCIMLVAQGIFFSFGVFFESVLTEFGWTRAITSGAFSLGLVLTGLLSIVMGKLNDRIGPRIIVTGCGLFLCLGYLLMSQISAIWQLYLFYGLIIAIGTSALLAPSLSTIARWFVKRRGLMTGIAGAGVGSGITIMPLLASWLISIYSWRSSYVIFGIMALVLIIPAAQFLRRDPGQLGLSPYGEKEANEEDLDLQTSGFSLRQVIHTGQLRLFCALSFCFYFCIATIMVHIVIHATGLGIPALSAANILAIIGGASIIGGLIMGSVADRIGNKHTIITCFILMSVAIAWLIVIKELWMFYLFATIFGLGYGGMRPLKSPMTAELFGLSSHGMILGIAFFTESIGGVIGPVLAGGIFDISGSYQWAFLICVAISAIGIILTSFLSPMNSGGGTND